MMVACYGQPHTKKKAEFTQLTEEKMKRKQHKEKRNSTHCETAHLGRWLCFCLRGIGGEFL
jgi:hypothetical protein